MPWPTSQDYNEAIQSPAQCFGDAQLRRGEAACNMLGLPAACSGNFADVYQLNDGQNKWAVKCFTRQIPGLRERYQQIGLFLENVNLAFMVPFTFLDQGIRIRGQWYPVLKMGWVEGFTLNQFVRENLDKPTILDKISRIWVRLARSMRQATFAHCDLQHGNVMLVPASSAGAAMRVKLVDYDGMCVPSLTLLKSIEVGHPSYQHPQRQREGIFSLEVDRFPLLVIYTALRALSVAGKPLWDKFDNGDNMLFRQQDLEAPARSPLFAELLRMKSDVRALACTLIDAVRLPLNETPLLEEIAPEKTEVEAVAVAAATPAVVMRASVAKMPVLPATPYGSLQRAPQSTIQPALAHSAETPAKPETVVDTSPPPAAFPIAVPVQSTAYNWASLTEDDPSPTRRGGFGQWLWKLLILAVMVGLVVAFWPKLSRFWSKPSTKKDASNITVNPTR